jgi:phage baseplate assembly protein V
MSNADFLSNFRKLIGPFQRRIAMMIGRGVILLSDDTGLLQRHQLTLIQGETLSGVDVLGAYGFTANPINGAEAVAVAVAGNRSDLVVIAVGDRRYRMKGLAQGEAALYDDQGQTVYLTRDGIVIKGAGKPIMITNAPSVRMECALNVTGDIKDNCDAAGQTMAAMRNFDTSHLHNGVQPGSGQSGAAAEGY